MADIITNKLLGTTVQVRVKRYGDGMISYQEVTAGKSEKRKQPGESNPDFDAGFIKALATVA
jgi:hypothetical protein